MQQFTIIVTLLDSLSINWREREKCQFPYFTNKMWTTKVQMVTEQL